MSHKSGHVIILLRKAIKDAEEALATAKELLNKLEEDDGE